MWRQIHRYPGSLPDTGGLRDQDAGLLDRLDVVAAVWRAYVLFGGEGTIEQRFRHSPGLFEMYQWVEQLREDMADSEDTEDV